MKVFELPRIRQLVISCHCNHHHHRHRYCIITLGLVVYLTSKACGSFVHVGTFQFEQQNTTDKEALLNYTSEDRTKRCFRHS